METKYPWLEASDGALGNTPVGPKNPAPEKPTRTTKDLLRGSLPWLGLVVAVLLLSIFARKDQATVETSGTVATIDVVSPLVPIGRGHPVLAEQLRLVPLAKKDLTKPQLLQIVRDEDLTKLKGRVVARKNLPPGRPLFWTDLEWKSESPLSITPQVIYPSKD